MYCSDNPRRSLKGQVIQVHCLCVSGTVDDAGSVVSLSAERLHYSKETPQ